MPESRHFWENGEKKIYCGRCLQGPFHIKDPQLVKVGSVSHICSNCKRLLSSEKNKSNPEGYTTSGVALTATHPVHIKI